MARFITVDDFTGYYDLPTDAYSEVVLQGVIDEFEDKYLVQLLGAELYNLFIADYDAENPTANAFSEPRFEVIFEPFAIDDNCGILDSSGIVKMLLGFIWFEYARDSNVKQNIGGFYKNEQANGIEAPMNETKIYQVENKSINIYRIIQYYICLNPQNYDYDLFNGQIKDYNSEL